MPKLSLSGRIAAGVGDNIVSIDRIAIARGGAVAWLGERLLYQRHDGDRWYIAAHDSAAPFLDRRGDRIVAGGAERWAAFLAASPAQCFGSLGEMPGAYPLAAGADGTLAIRRDYLGDGPMTLYAPGGSVVEVPGSEAAYDVCYVWPHAVVWTQRNIFRAFGVATPAQAGGAWNATYVVVGGVAWVVYWTQPDRRWPDQALQGLIAHPAADASAGYILETDDRVCFNPDAVALSDGRLRVTYSRTQGERPQDIVVVDLDLSAPRVSLHVSPAPPADPPPVVTPPVTPEPLPEPPVEPPAPPPVPTVGYYGLSTGIQQPTDPAILAELKTRGWEIARYDVMPAPGQNRRASTPAEIAEIVRRVRAAGMSPLILCLASQFGDVPEGCDVEARAFPDLSKGGLEPNFDRAHPAAEQAREINRWMPIARQRRQRVWALAGNFDGAAQQWHGQFVAALDPDVGISPHPYPLGSARGWYERAGEIAAFKQIIGSRPWCVGEWGITQGPIDNPAPKFGWAWFAWLFGKRTHWHLSDEQRAAWINQDFEMWKAAGARFACLYQIVDGKPCPQHPTMPATAIEGYGIRRAGGSWKLVSPY